MACPAEQTTFDGAGEGGVPAPAPDDSPQAHGAQAAVQLARARRRARRVTRRYLSAGLALVLVGALVFQYPNISSWLNQQEMERVRNVQQQAVEQAAPQDLSDEWQAAVAYNERLAGAPPSVADAFGAQAMAGTREYDELLDLAGDGVMGSIEFPSLGVSLPVYHGVGDEALERGAGHLPATSLPVGGVPSHCVVTGHTGLPSARLFDAIDQLQLGDWFVLEVLDQTLAYQVSGIDVVLPDQVESLAMQPGADLVTLVTCTPYGVNSHRLLVHAKRIDVPASWWERPRDAGFPPNVFYPQPMAVSWAFFGALFALVVVAAALAVRRRLRKRKGERG